MQSDSVNLKFLRAITIALLVFDAGMFGFVSAQSLSVTGYFENQLTPQQIGGKLRWQEYNKVRFDFSSEINDNLTFHGNYNIRVFHGATQFNALDFIPESVVAPFLESAGIPMSALLPELDFSFEDESFLDNAYVSFYGDHFNFRVGKQQLPWGTGYSWNPTDQFHDKNLLDPAYEKTGVNALKLEIPFGGQAQFTAVLGIGDSLTSSTKGLKMKHHLKGYDLSVSFIEKQQSLLDLASFSEKLIKRRMYGFDFSGELLGLGVWGEGAYNSLANADNFGQYLVGADYTFNSGLYLVSEYYRNGLGKSRKEDYSLTDWLRLLNENGENLGRNYVFVGQSYPIAELWTWANFAIYNFDDHSGLAFPWITWNFDDNAEILFVGYIPFGPESSEYGEFGAGGFARIRIYF